jgi:hypothetical protein
MTLTLARLVAIVQWPLLSDEINYRDRVRETLEQWQEPLDSFIEQWRDDDRP